MSINSTQFASGPASQYARLAGDWRKLLLAVPSCGASESEAEGLMSHDEAGHCFFARQPTTEEVCVCRPAYANRSQRRREGTAAESTSVFFFETYQHQSVP